ncbi:MAG: hypothetical protein LBE47_02130 [Methanomassiliicoccaceae archaeon]|jgi:hypothetical protein|nr:hypothetical protein [Methanomassiliicoccaceae archaeon]
MFGKKETVLLDTSLTIGEFDPSADGAYNNVKTFPLDVRSGKRLFVSVDSDMPVDVALSDSGGICIKFKNSILNDTIGPIETVKKGTLTLFLGVFRGDKAELKVKVWAE